MFTCVFLICFCEGAEGALFRGPSQVYPEPVLRDRFTCDKAQQMTCWHGHSAPDQQTNHRFKGHFKRGSGRASRWFLEKISGPRFYSPSANHWGLIRPPSPPPRAMRETSCKGFAGGFGGGRAAARICATVKKVRIALEDLFTRSLTTHRLSSGASDSSLLFTLRAPASSHPHLRKKKKKKKKPSRTSEAISLPSFAVNVSVHMQNVYVEVNCSAH